MSIMLKFLNLCVGQLSQYKWPWPDNQGLIPNWGKHFEFCYHVQSSSDLTQART
jgi:hypothetical protein